MNPSLKWTVLAAALSLAAVSLAQAPADAPAGSNGLCKDGTYSQSAVKKGACHGHKGVKEWYAGAPTGAAPTVPAAAAPAAAAPATAPVPAKKSATGTGASVPAANAAPGGGPGMVWVNTSSNVYHCPNDRWYGKTEHGQYMSEAAAKARSARPDHGKACQ